MISSICISGFRHVVSEVNRMLADKKEKIVFVFYVNKWNKISPEMSQKE